MASSIEETHITEVLFCPYHKVIIAMTLLLILHKMCHVHIQASVTQSNTVLRVQCSFCPFLFVPHDNSSAAVFTCFGRVYLSLLPPSLFQHLKISTHEELKMFTTKTSQPSSISLLHHQTKEKKIYRHQNIVTSFRV